MLFGENTVCKKPEWEEFIPQTPGANTNPRENAHAVVDVPHKLTTQRFDDQIFKDKFYKTSTEI